jgi:hypothetical protein
VLGIDWRRPWLPVGRLLYGHRDEPYQVLTLLGRRLEASVAPDAVLQTIVDTISEALKVPYAAVEVGQAGAYVNAAEHGRCPRSGDGLLNLSLAQGGEEVGRLLLAHAGAARNSPPPTDGCSTTWRAGSAPRFRPSGCRPTCAARVTNWSWPGRRSAAVSDVTCTMASVPNWRA